MEIPYDESKKERDRITAEREKKLYQSFENMRKQIDEQIQTMNFSTVSERVKRQQLEEIRHELQKQLQGHYNALEAGLKDDMVEVGGAVLKESEAFYSALQMPIGMSITSFPVEIMNNVVNGSVYDEKWYLSRALWGDYTEKLDQINEVISNGIGLNLSSFEIAKQLEQYVDPSAMTPSKTIVTHCLQDPVTGKLYSKDYVKRHPEKDWTGFKEKDSKFRYGKVDYNAQRLARTLINHAYQQNVVHQAQANPFATGVRWDASGGERMCEICEERDGKIFPADDVPLDHPNGMCTFEVVTALSMMEMSDVLADFVKGEPTEYDDKLYAWYNDRAEVPIERVPDTFAQHVIAEGRDISGEWQRRPDQYDFEIEDVMAAQGFDGLPRVVSKEEFEAAVKAANDGNGFIAQRTYSAPDQETLDMYRDMLYNGKWYVDCGTGGAQYGQGMYCAADYNGQLTDGIKTEMQHYIELNVSRGNPLSYVETLTLDQSARIITYEDLVQRYESYTNAAFDVMGRVQREARESVFEKLASESGHSVKDYERMVYLHEHAWKKKDLAQYDSLRSKLGYPSINSVDEIRQSIKNETEFLFKNEFGERITNIGSYATALGYDAINAEGHGASSSYTVVLNRTKLIIQGDD